MTDRALSAYETKTGYSQGNLLRRRIFTTLGALSAKDVDGQSQLKDRLG